METLAAIYRVFGRVSVWASWAGGLALMLAAVMITIEVIGRKFGGVEPSFLGIGFGFVVPQFRIPGSDEITGYVFACATTWAYAYCLIHRSNIRIDALYNVLPMGLRACLDVLGLAMLLFYMGYFTWKAQHVFTESWSNDSVAVSVLQTPLWIPQLIWLLGLVFFVVVLTFLTVYTVVTFVVQGAAAVQKMAGTMSVQEEVAESTQGVREIGK